MENYFDPREYVRGLQQILISDSKRIGFLFGAGTSFALKKGASDKSKIPRILPMTDIILKNIKSTVPKYVSPLEKISEELIESKLEVTIENILSNITQKHSIVGKEKLYGLEKSEWKDLKDKIEEDIKSLVSVHKYKDDFIENFLQGDFAHWVKNSGRKEAIEIFTTNYDYLLELGFESNDVPYYDGFIGCYCPYFFPSSVEDLQFLPLITKLWKLHGSLGWHYNEKLRKVTRSLPDDGNIMVYPSFLKYDDSKKQPYISFMDRLSNFIKKDDCVLFICGYSFNDFHINEILMNALERSDTSHIVIFYYDRYLDENEIFYGLNYESHVKKIALSNKKLSIYGMNSAIIGSKFGRWKVKDHIIKDEDAVLLDLYFEDVYSAENYLPKNAFTRIERLDFNNSKLIWTFLKDSSIINDSGILTTDFEKKLDVLKFVAPFDKLEIEIKEIVKIYNGWSGEGEFKLPDFSHFINLLSNLSSEDYIKKISKSNGSK